MQPARPGCGLPGRRGQRRRAGLWQSDRCVARLHQTVFRGRRFPGPTSAARFVRRSDIWRRGLTTVGYVRIARSINTRGPPRMATGETGFTDIAFDLVSIQYHALKAGHDYGQYVRDAENAGQDEVASFFKQVQQEDQERASRCSELLKQIAEADHAGPAAAS